MLIEHPHSHEVMYGAAWIAQSSLVAFLHTHDVGRVLVALKFRVDVMMISFLKSLVNLSLYLLTALEGVFSLDSVG